MGMNLDGFLSTRAGIGSLFDDSEEKTFEQLKRNQGLFEGLNLPEFEAYRPEELRYLGDYRPDDASFQQISEDPRIRSAQLSALAKMAGLAETGLSAEDAAGFDQARSLANQEARAGMQAALQNASARGVSGSGLEFALREAANQAGAERAQQAALNQAATSARQRALYQQAYGDDLAGVRGQDADIAARNAAIINQFNMANTQARNQAQQANLLARQNLSNANTVQRNDAVKYRNEMLQQGFNNQYQRASGMAGANTAMAQGYAAQNAARAAGRAQDAQLLGTILGGAMGGGAGAAAGGAKGGGGGGLPAGFGSTPFTYDSPAFGTYR